MKRAALFLVVSLTYLALDVSPVLSSGVCASHNDSCPMELPCCNGGQCGSSASSCGDECDASASFPGACLPHATCISHNEDFSSPSWPLVTRKMYKYDGNAWVSEFSPDYASLETADGGHGTLRLSMREDEKPNQFGRKQGFGSTVYYPRFFQYGRVEARLRTGWSGGVVTALTIKSEGGDEIDWEWVGANMSNVQSNYYYRGELVHTNVMYHDVSSGDTHEHDATYVIDWTPDAITWQINGETVRKLNKNDTWDEGAKMHKYPVQEARVSFSIWDGGQGADGTRDWSGGPTNWDNSDQEYYMEVLSVSVKCWRDDRMGGLEGAVQRRNWEQSWEMHDMNGTMEVVARPPSPTPRSTSGYTRVHAPASLAWLVATTCMFAMVIL